jgi:hypothetical protein
MVNLYDLEAASHLRTRRALADAQHGKGAMIDALTAAYFNADRVPLYPDDCKEGHRAGVRDCAMRLGVYEEFCDALDEATP